MSSTRQDVGVFIAIIFCGLALYLLPIQNTTFHYDDNNSIINDQAIRGLDIPGIFNAFNTRFLVGLTFALNYKFCALQPIGYRLTNLLIHCLNAFLVYLLARSTLYLYSAGKQLFFGRLEWPAFFASILFLCHPIQTEPVNFITQRFVLMGTFFYLLTLFLYIQYRCRSQKRYMIAAMCSAMAAMFCKEFVVTLGPMLTLYDVSFLSNATIWKRFKSLLPFYVIVLIVPFLLLRTTPETIGVANIVSVNNIQGGETKKYGNHIDITRAHGSIGREQYFLTELNVVCTYVRLLFFPINQNVDYDYPISYRIDGKTALCGIFLFCLLGVAWVMYRSYRVISFSILWFFIALSVESSFIPIGDVITEYRLYLASVGFVFLVMSLIYMRQADQRLLNLIAVIILMACSVLTYQRNKIWKNEITLWSDTVRKSVHKSRPYNDLGAAYIEKGNFAQAMLDFNKAITLDPKYADAYYNRGSIYYKNNNFTEFVVDSKKNIEINPKNVKHGNFNQAMSDFNKAIEIDPNFAGAYLYRGLILEKQGNLTQAIDDFNKVIEINPHFAMAYLYRGLILEKQGKLDQALDDFNKIIELYPKYAAAYYNRGRIYQAQGHFTQAAADYTKAKSME